MKLWSLWQLPTLANVTWFGLSIIAVGLLSGCMAEDQVMRPIAESVDGLIIDDTYFKEQFDDIPGISRTNNFAEIFGLDDEAFKNVGSGEIAAGSKSPEKMDKEELPFDEGKEAASTQKSTERVVVEGDDKGIVTEKNSSDNEEVDSHDKSAVVKETKDQEELKIVDAKFKEPGEDQKKPIIGNSIGEHIARKIEEELLPERRAEDAGEEFNKSTATEPATMITGVSTAVISTSGGTTTSVTTVTFEPTYTRIKRCIYGCRVVTIETAAAKIEVVTALPVTVPCSLVICPPCGCTTKIVRVTGCPVITTVTPPDSFVIVTNDTTITFFTVTTTITSCTATTCLTPITITVTQTSESLSLTTVTQFSTLSLTTITQFSTERQICTPTPIVPDGCCPAGYDWDGKSDEPVQGCGCSKPEPPDCPCQPKPKPERRCGCKSRGCMSCAKQPIPPMYGGSSPFFNFKAQAGESKDDQHEINDVSSDRDCTPCEPNTPQKPCPPEVVVGGSCQKACHEEVGRSCQKACHGVPSGVTSTITGSICTTFVVCNPVQFACPAQVTGAAQLPKFMENWDLSPRSIPGGFPYAYLAGGAPKPGMEYLGYDGVMHGIGGYQGYIPPANSTDPSSISINVSGSISTTCTSSTSTSQTTNKDSRVKAASNKNQADSQAKSSLLIILGIASAFYGFIA